MGFLCLKTPEREKMTLLPPLDCKAYGDVVDITVEPKGEVKLQFQLETSQILNLVLTRRAAGILLKRMVLKGVVPLPD
jgi:hypothetical protein